MVIAGTFHEITVGETPTGYPERAAVLYLAFRDVRKDCSFEIEFVDVANNKTLLHFETFKLHAASPFETVELAVPLPELPLPQPGPYSFDVFCEQAFLGTLRIKVVEEKEAE